MINLVRARKKSRVEILSTNGLLGASPNLIVGGRDIYTPKVTRATNLGVEKHSYVHVFFRGSSNI